MSQATAATVPGSQRLLQALSALRHRNYRLYWFGQLSSVLAQNMEGVAQSWLVLELTNSPFRLGVVSALQFGPVLLLSAIAGVVFDNVQEGLIKVDRTGKMVPWLAERWYTTDNKNYTFFLRKGVRFHNGRELKAGDVKFALDRAVNPETKHPYRTQYDAIQDVIVKDDYTVTVALKRVEGTFL
jgi:ABC-type transport system substrate-binding protein